METYLLEMAEQYAVKCKNCGDTSFDEIKVINGYYGYKLRKNIYCQCWRKECPFKKRTVGSQVCTVRMNRLCMRGDIPIFLCSRVTPELWLEYLQKERENGRTDKNIS